MVLAGAVSVLLVLSMLSCGPLTRAQWLAEQERGIARATETLASATDDPARARALTDLGRARSEKARYARAFKLVDAAECGRRFAEAVADHDRAITLAPDDARAFLGRGLTLFDHASVEEPEASATAALYAATERDLTSALERDGGIVQALDMRGVVRTCRGDRDGAIDDFTRLVALDRDLGTLRLQEAYCERASLHHRAGRLDAAIDDYESSMRLGASADGCSCQPQSPLVALYREQGRYDEAWDAVRRAGLAGTAIAPEVLAGLSRDSGRRGGSSSMRSRSSP